MNLSFNNSFVGAAARLEANGTVAAGVRVGAGASTGLGARVGSYGVVGADVHVLAPTLVGRYCAIDVPGACPSLRADGVFVDPLFPLPVRLHGPTSGRKLADEGVAP